MNDTLVYLREKYWILRGRQATRKVVRSCITCKRIEGPPYPSIPSPVLPIERVSEDPPFSHTGVDFAGPLYITSCTQGSEVEEKVYICSFTCAATRDIHLELVRDMSVDTFLLALRRFASRRGLPATIISKTFKGSSKEVTKIVRAAEVQTLNLWKESYHQP